MLHSTITQEEDLHYSQVVQETEKDPTLKGATLQKTGVCAKNTAGKRTRGADWLLEECDLLMLPLSPPITDEAR